MHPKSQTLLEVHIFYGKNKKKEQKLLARIQNKCYNGHAREPLGLSRNNEEVLSALGAKEFLFSKKVGAHILGRRSRRSDCRKPAITNGNRILKKLSALVLAEERKNGKKQK